MSDQSNNLPEKVVVGHLTGKTTTHEVTLLISNPDVNKNNYFVIYDKNKQNEDGTREYYLLDVIKIWNSRKGLKAKLKVVGERPLIPFDMGAEAYLATEEQIKKVLGVFHAPKKSISIGKLLSYDFDVNLLVKNIGRIFITGKSGSGKSYTMGVLAEEFLEKGIPIVIIDRHGEYGSLKVAAEQRKKKKSEKKIEEDPNRSAADLLESEEKRKKNPEGTPNEEEKGLDLAIEELIGDEISAFCPWCGSEVSPEEKVCPNCGEELPDVEKDEQEADNELERLEEELTEKSKPVDGGSSSAEEQESETIEANESGESKYIDQIIEFSKLSINEGADVDLEYLFSQKPNDIVAPNLCSIINLRGMDLEVQEIITSKLLNKLYKAATLKEIPPFYLFLDEAHLFAGKKKSDTREIVKLFAQEGRKFGANIVLSTQRPQLLDTTIRSQAGTWIVHQLSDVRDISITIASAEDLTKENEADVSGLDKGEAIICGEAVTGIPIFVKVRRRETKHGGMGFNALDFLSDQTVEELKERKQRILSNKTEEELELGKTTFEELKKPKDPSEYLEEITDLKTEVKRLRAKVEDLEDKNARLRTQLEKTTQPQVDLTNVATSEAVKKKIKKFKVEADVWKEKYKVLKENAKKLQGSGQAEELRNKLKKIRGLEHTIKQLNTQIQTWKNKYQQAIQLAEKSITELKKTKRK
ncbi:MAG: helicase HerA domain-containing protein [Promethearchaeia archaeon]